MPRAVQGMSGPVKRTQQRAAQHIALPATNAIPFQRKSASRSRTSVRISTSTVQCELEPCWPDVDGLVLSTSRVLVVLFEGAVSWSPLTSPSLLCGRYDQRIVRDPMAGHHRVPRCSSAQRPGADTAGPGGPRRFLELITLNAGTAVPASMLVPDACPPLPPPDRGFMTRTASATADFECGGPLDVAAQSSMETP